MSESKNQERQELERYARILVNQTSRLIPKLKMETSTVENGSGDFDAFGEVSDAYEQLAAASKRTDAVVWERTTVDGRTGADLMQRLWEARSQIRRLDQPESAQSAQS